MIYTVVQDEKLLKAATSSMQGRQFWTGGRLADAVQHLKRHPDDVCMVRHSTENQEGENIVLLGGPIQSQNLLDVTNHDFAHIADSFDVGEMTSLVKELFQRDFQKDVSISILESGEVLKGLGASSTKLISLSRQDPALLDMAATEDGRTIGQYSTARTLGHSGDQYSIIGGVRCLHHEVTMRPTDPGGVRLYFLAGYSSKPLKAWRGSRVFWIVYDDDQRACWLVPHDLSHAAVGDTVSVTMPLVSTRNGGSLSVLHLARPVQASLESASPLQHNVRDHLAYITLCLETARAIDWNQGEKAAPESTKLPPDNNEKTSMQVEQDDGKETAELAPARVTAIFDGCRSQCVQGLPQKMIFGKGGPSLSPMRGPLKVLAGGCCAASRVVLVDGTATKATSEVNLVHQQLSGVIVVQANDNPDIYKLHQIRWNMARGRRTLVIAITPDGCKHVCGPMPPCYVNEDVPTPMAGSPISDEDVRKLIEFALSDDGDSYFGSLYQAIPSYQECEQDVASFIINMQEKDFRAIKGAEPEEELAENASFTDDDFRRLMEIINTVSVSSSTPVERNGLGIRIAKFLRQMSKQIANKEIDTSQAFQKHVSDLELINMWTGDNIDWALDNQDVLEDILKGSNIKIVARDDVEIDLELQEKLSEAIKDKKAHLRRAIHGLKTSKINGWKKTFNAVFQPALEALMRSIGDEPKYRNFFPEVKLPNINGVIARASQSNNKEAVGSKPEHVMKLFHKLGATGFVSFTINFLQVWKTKVINQICLVDRPGEGFNNPETYVPISYRIEDGPADPAAAYETDVRHRFVLPTFPRLPKLVDDLVNDDNEEEDDDDDEGMYREMPIAPAKDDLAKYVLMRAEFLLRDPEQGPKQPMWRYVDWLFHRIYAIHKVPEKQAAPLAIRALGFSIERLMTGNPNPSNATMEIVSSIIIAISFMSARGDPPHACIDTFFNMNSTYVPQTKDIEKSPWQIEVINIISRAVDYVRPIISKEEYTQIRANFQRAAANMVKRQIVQKLLDHVQAEAKKTAESIEDYVARVNNEFYPAYREIVETVAMLLEADPATFQLTDELRKRIDLLYSTIVVKWARSMRRCRVGYVRKMVETLKAFSEREGRAAMSYVVSRKDYLTNLYDKVYHIKYESRDHALVEEVCLILQAKTRNPGHEKHEKWLARVDQAMQDISSYDEKMKGFAHCNNYKNLPIDQMLKVLKALKADPASKTAVKFEDVKAMLAHVKIEVQKPSDLKVQSHEPYGKGPVYEKLRGAWWMCPDVSLEGTEPMEEEPAPSVALIPMGVPSAGVPTSSNVFAILGDTYHKFKLARLYSGSLRPMRSFIRENYKFHLEWFEETIRAAGLPQNFDPAMVKGNETMTIYAIVQRLVHELVQDGNDRGDNARDRVYGEVVDPMSAEGSSTRKRCHTALASY